MMIAFEAVASSTSLSVMDPTLVDDLTRTFSVDIRTSESASTSTEPVTSPLMINARSFNAGLANLLGKSFERHAGTLGQLRLAFLHLAGTRDALGLVAIIYDEEGIA